MKRIVCALPSQCMRNTCKCAFLNAPFQTSGMSVVVVVSFPPRPPPPIADIANWLQHSFQTNLEASWLTTLTEDSSSRFHELTIGIQHMEFLWHFSPKYPSGKVEPRESSAHTDTDTDRWEPNISEMFYLLNEDRTTYVVKENSCWWDKLCILKEQSKKQIPGLRPSSLWTEIYNKNQL